VALCSGERGRAYACEVGSGAVDGLWARRAFRPDETRERTRRRKLPAHRFVEHLERGLGVGGVATKRLEREALQCEDARVAAAFGRSRDRPTSPLETVRVHAARGPSQDHVRGLRSRRGRSLEGLQRRATISRAPSRQTRLEPQ